jgi:ferredoxin
MPLVTISYGEKVRTVEAGAGTLLGDAIAASELPLEQPCAGRGTCGKCKVLIETGASPPDEVELENLTSGELAVGNRLACRARVQDDVKVALAPIVVYSNKIFRASTRYKRSDSPLGNRLSTVQMSSRGWRRLPGMRLTPSGCTGWHWPRLTRPSILSSYRSGCASA